MTKRKRRSKTTVRRHRRMKDSVDVPAMIKAMNLNLVKWRWYGFDIDGTIADNSMHGWGIDDPIRPMVALMKWLHARGYDVRILSGRTGDYYSDEEIPMMIREHIWEWCDENLGFRPALTGRKDSSMEALFDDRAKQVICNKGITYEQIARELAKAIDGVASGKHGMVKYIEHLRNRCVSLGLLSGE